MDVLLNIVLTVFAMETCTLARSTGVSAASSSLRSSANMGAKPLSTDDTAPSKRSSCALTSSGRVKDSIAFTGVST